MEGLVAEATHKRSVHEHVDSVLAVVLLKQPWSLAVLAVFSIYVVENLVVALINASFAKRSEE